MIIPPNIFLNNKYFKWYVQIVQRRINTPYEGVGEWHHYIPKSILSNDNLVFLSLREHYMAHLLLVKAVVPEYKSKMLYALTAMKMKTVKHTNFNSHLFEQLKLKANLSRSVNKRGVPRSPETKQKIREARLGSTATEETKLKISLAHKGRSHSADHIEKVRQFHLGRKRSEETKQKLREDRARRVPKECPHCHQHILPGNYNRWHGDNCKLNQQKSSHDE